MGIKFRLGAGLLLAVSLLTASVMASAQDEPPPYDIHAYEFYSPEFHDVWERTDRPVQERETTRTWLWGPGANTPLIDEPYEEAEDGTRQVQYGDKSRMEMPVPGSAAAASSDSPWHITQGLLARELMTGRLQIGDDLFEDHEPSNHPAAGDPDGKTSPTYATMGMLMDADPRSKGNVITQLVHRDGTLEDTPHLTEYGITDEYFIEQTGYYIADVFWDFMNSTGPVYEDGALQDGPVFESPFYAVGFPLTPAVWSWTKVDNEKQNVLVQCFERRCLTYTPDNDPDWQVETGNVGQHYFHWRYQEIDELPDDDDNGAPPADDGENGDEDENGDENGNGDPPPAVEPASFTVSEPSGPNPVGSTLEITVTVEGDNELPFIGARVSAEVTDGPHKDTDLENADGETNAVTDNDGIATLSYTGTDAGEDTITVTVQGIDDSKTVTKTWVVIDPKEIFLAHDAEELTGDGFDPDDFEPDDPATNTVGTSHTVYALVLDEDGNPVPNGTEIDFAVTTPNLNQVSYASGTRLTMDGIASFTYTGPTEPREDGIVASWTGEGDDPPKVTSNSLIKEWVVGPPANLTLEMFGEDAEPINEVNTSHRVLAEVTDQHGNPVIVNVTFSIEGESDSPDAGHHWTWYPGNGLPDQNTVEINTTERETNADGVVGFSYRSQGTGEDTIMATVTVADGDPLTATSEKLWCSAVVVDGGSIQAAVDSVSSGALVCVEPGDYVEQIRIETNGLTLLALGGPDVTTIAAAPMPDQGGVVGIIADDVTVTGFTIDNEGDDNGRAVRVSNSTDGVTVQDNVFTNSRRGVQGNWAATSEHGGPITNLTITGNTFDVEFGIAGTEDMDGLVITGNTFATTEEGVGLGEGVDNWELHTNHFEGLGSHVADHRDEPSEIDLNAIIDANTFEAEVHVVGDAIVDVD